MVARDFAVDDQAVTDFLYTGNHTVVMQDVDALAIVEDVVAQEERSGGEYRELSIAIDAGALAARRLMRRLADTADSVASV